MQESPHSAAETIDCPMCGETIKAKAIKCRHCHSDLMKIRKREQRNSRVLATRKTVTKKGVQARGQLTSKVRQLQKRLAPHLRIILISCGLFAVAYFTVLHPIIGKLSIEWQLRLQNAGETASGVYIGIDDVIFDRPLYMFPEVDEDSKFDESLNWVKTGSGEKYFRLKFNSEIPLDNRHAIVTLYRERGIDTAKLNYDCSSCETSIESIGRNKFKTVNLSGRHQNVRIYEPILGGQPLGASLAFALNEGDDEVFRIIYHRILTSLKSARVNN